MRVPSGFIISRIRREIYSLQSLNLLWWGQRSYAQGRRLLLLLHLLTNSTKTIRDLLYCRLTVASFITTLNIYLAQHAQGHVDGGQQGSKRRSHIRVKRWSCEAQHKQGSIFCQIHTLTRKRRHKSECYSPLCFSFVFLHEYQQFDYDAARCKTN